MPPRRVDDGPVAATRIRLVWPDTGVLVLSQFVQRRYALELIGGNPAGVGYLLKERIGEVARFVADVHEVGSGGTTLDPEVMNALMTTAARSRRDPDLLTPRQREVLELVAQGRSNAAIATRLEITEQSVVQHVSRIYDELGLEANSDDHRGSWQSSATSPLRTDPGRVSTGPGSVSAMSGRSPGQLVTPARDGAR
jgi:DNA-binding NarL/FixJ family response regulator